MRHLLWLLATTFVITAAAATLPSGFTETALTSSLSAGTAMALAPDGRIFVSQQSGAMRVIKNGALLSQPFLTVTVDSSGERGLQGVAFDPNFAANQFVYIYNWPFDDGSGTTAADTSGNGHNGVVNNASWTAGKVNSALSFDGTTSSVITTGIPLANIFSISAWVNSAVSTQLAYSRIAETQYNGGLYLGTNAAGSAYQFIVNTASGATGSCGAAYGCAIGGTVSPGWHMVTGTYDGTIGRLYVDSALVASETFTSPPNTNFRLTIGRYYGSNGFGWNGAIDEVRLYNTALTAAQVSALFTWAQ
jgi:hypothetical protein